MTEVHDLAAAGMRAGFSVEQIIRLLNLGISYEALLELIEKRTSEGHIVIRGADG